MNGEMSFLIAIHIIYSLHLDLIIWCKALMPSQRVHMKVS